jgi:Protein of unknown function (DUF4065)
MATGKKFAENEDRFKELILYISQRCADDQGFNTLKLNKLMFFADFFAYAILGAPITGFEYIKLQRGPAPRRMPEVKKAMEEARELGFQELPLQPWKRTVNLRRPKLSVFEAEQISLVDSLIHTFAKADGDIVSEISHQMPCWIIPAIGETIPYEMVFLSQEPLTDIDIERGTLVAKEFGLLEHTAHHA